jgi:leucyl aminopeptidase (aminopeptidase T)
MGVKEGERVLIITDTEKQNIGKALFEAAINVKSEAMFLIMLPRSRHGEEPPQGIVELMKYMNVVVAPTVCSLTHTQARREASAVGVRIATMPNISEAMFSKGGLTADFQAVRKRIEEAYEKIKSAKTAHITTALGTDLEMKISVERWVMDTGILWKKGEFGNLPAGELFQAPKEGTANGRLREILINASEKLDNAGDNPKQVFNIAELGIGMNDKAKVIGSPLEDEKVLGTIHVALGDNSTFGGKVRAGIHLDGIVMKPTLVLDDVELIKNGKLRL